VVARVPVWRQPENLDLCPGARGSAGRVAGMHGLMAKRKALMAFAKGPEGDRQRLARR